MHTVFVAVGALGTVWALVAGCDATVGIGGTPSVGKDALQTDIAARLAKAGEEPQSVRCEQDLVGEVGKTARCEVVMSPTNTFEPVITVTGADGDTIDYEMRPAISEEQLEKAVSRLVADASHAQVVSVSCESGLDGKAGATAQCEVDSGGVKLRRTVEVNKVEGLMMNFDVVPVLTKEEVASSLLDEFQKQSGRRPDSAQCAGNLEGRAGNTIECTVVTGQDAASYTLTVTAVSGGSINYSYAAPPLGRLRKLFGHSRYRLVDDRAHGALGGLLGPHPDRARHFIVQFDRRGIWDVRHHAVVGAARQHLRDDSVQRPEHLVAAGLEHRLVKDLVRQQICLEIARPAVHHHVGDRGRHDPALMRVGAPRGQRRGRGFEPSPQLRERHQLGGSVADLQSPPNHDRIEDVPLLGRLNRDSHPAARCDHAHRLQHADRLTGDAARHPVLRADPVERDHLPGRVLAGHDRGAQRGEQIAVQSADVCLGGHAYILS